jgi:hypothetical protein
MEVSSMSRSVALALSILFTGSTALAQVGANAQPPTEYVATTANLTPGSGTPLTIRIFKWSSDEERKRVLAVLATASTEKSGTPDLIKQLAGSPSIGQIWTDGPIGYALKYSHRLSLPDGRERIVVVTDRPLGAVDPGGLWKAEGQSETVPPFTVVELHVGKDGKGEGKMSVGAPSSINAEDNTVGLTNYATAPVTLRNVHLKPRVS